MINTEHNIVRYGDKSRRFITSTPVTPAVERLSFKASGAQSKSARRPPIRAATGMPGIGRRGDTALAIGGA